MTNECRPPCRMYVRAYGTLYQLSAPYDIAHRARYRARAHIYVRACALRIRPTTTKLVTMQQVEQLASDAVPLSQGSRSLYVQSLETGNSSARHSHNWTWTQPTYTSVALRAVESSTGTYCNMRAVFTMRRAHFFLKQIQAPPYHSPLLFTQRVSFIHPVLYSLEAACESRLNRQRVLPHLISICKVLTKA